MATVSDRRKMKLGIEARNAARRRLQEENAEKFKKMLEEERVKRGLPRTPTGPTAAQLRQRIQREQKALEKLQKELEAAEQYQ